ncbi:MAG: hypothetical protein HQK83_18580 [Fibrobacteria bacterium]|nr:hypothetical protein [Fibrobacteria bacterium]
MSSELIQLASGISCFPMLHGKAPFCLELRRQMWNNAYDCIAISLPERLRDDLIMGVQKLPIIYAVTVEVDGETIAYAPVDPCDACIESIRQGLQRQIPIHFVEDDILLFHQEHLVLPDAHLLKHIGTEKYFETCAEFLKDVESDQLILQRAQDVLERLSELQERYSNILYICDYPILVAMQSAKGSLGQKVKTLSERPVPQDNEYLNHISGVGRLIQTKLFPVNPDQLYFALGELPFYAAEMEKERFNPMAPLSDYLELMKKIFLETRDNYLKQDSEAHTINLVRLQASLKYLRNLTVLGGRLTPDLFDIVTVAKGVFGPHYAGKILEAAKYYPFFELFDNQPYMKVGFGRIQTPFDEEYVEAVNIFQDEPREWRTIQIKKEPDPEEKKKYQYAWDPRGMCSHVPEDVRIEGFNKSVRHKSRQIVSASQTKTEAFTSSIKDGIDVRETLRNWHTGSVYVKEQPPVQKQVDTVVVIFDSTHDEQYPQHTTWYAEHQEESTLTFFASDPFKDLIGPGIARSLYGGLCLIFPPRHIPDVFQLPYAASLKNLTEILVYGALLFSNEKQVAYVAAKKPGIRLKKLASKFNKRLLWIPLSLYSQETIRKLRTFHILNGNQVRSWASKFIME